MPANDVKLNFGSHPFYKIEPLLGEIDNLAAKSSLTIPVRVTRINDFSGTGGGGTGGGGTGTGGGGTGTGGGGTGTGGGGTGGGDAILIHPFSLFNFWFSWLVLSLWGK
ncbi:MAG UNVERIFIED_CONTAM: hypothetical protein LVR29_06025 [Microcystis novacekii LVE1205-3]